MASFDTKSQLPVLYTLATEFALCDHWFSSLPGPTWPNRFFVHCASSNGLDRSPTTGETAEWMSASGFACPNGTIYNMLDAHGIPYRLYNDDHNSLVDAIADPIGSVPQVGSLKGIMATQVRHSDDFEAEVSGPYGARYTFIEPNYGALSLDGVLKKPKYSGGSSQHPTDGTFGGEALTKLVYESIRNSPLWENSMLIITYDEHGGFYDSVPPPKAVPPGDGGNKKLNESGFKFDRYGFRVPAVIVSPWISKGTIDKTVYDHTSVIKTVSELFLDGAHLTNRDKNANSLLHLTEKMKKPRTDCLERLPDPVPDKEQLVSVSTTPPPEGAPPLLPKSGNAAGAMSIWLKIRLELTDDLEKHEQIVEEFRSLRTGADMDQFIETTNKIMAAAKK